jgi:hypothetical protein
MRQRCAAAGSWPMLAQLTELFDDPRTQRAGPALVVPGGAAIARLVLALGSGGAGGLRLVGILEAKQPRGDGENDDDRWVGFVYLGILPGEEVQRDATFGIALSARCLRVRARELMPVQWRGGGGSGSARCVVSAHKLCDRAHECCPRRPRAGSWATASSSSRCTVSR